MHLWVFPLDTILHPRLAVMWYDRLDKRYNFSLGPNVLGLMSTDSLTRMTALDPPFLKEYNEPIQDCLIDSECDDMTSLIGRTTYLLKVTVSLIKTMNCTSEYFDCRRGHIPSCPSTSLDFHLELWIRPILCIQDQLEHLEEQTCPSWNNLSSLLLFPPNYPGGSALLQAHIEHDQWPREEK